MKMIDMYLDELQVQSSAVNNEEYKSKYFEQRQEKLEVRYIKSMKEVEGW